jgi:predicted Zn-dependent protease
MRGYAALTVATLCGLAWAAPQSTQTGGDTSSFQEKVDQKHQKEVESDKKQGEDIAKEVAKQVKFSENEAYVERVSKIGGEIAAIANKETVEVTWGDDQLSQFDYKFFVIKGEDVNAFSVPGGYIYVYEGLVEFAESDDELAGVLAHEIAHASFRHIATMQKEQKSLDLLTIGAILAAIWSPRDAGAILFPTGLAIRGVQSGWSVKAEKAADFGGLQYMIKSKYNALGTLTFMERLAYRDRFLPKIDWGIYQTHPYADERARTLIEKLRTLDVPIARSTVTKSLRATNKIGDSGIELWFGQTKIHVFSGDTAQLRADRATDHLNEFFDRIPALYDVTVKSKVTLVGANRQLFDVVVADAEAENKGLAESVDAAYQALRKAVFDLGYRVWATRGAG